MARWGADATGDFRQRVVWALRITPAQKRWLENSLPPPAALGQPVVIATPGNIGESFLATGEDGFLRQFSAIQPRLGNMARQKTAAQLGPPVISLADEQACWAAPASRFTPWTFREENKKGPHSRAFFTTSTDYRLETFSVRYFATPSGEADIPSLPFSHCAGQTSPCSSWNCSASTMRSISSMLRPSGRSLTTW